MTPNATHHKHLQLDWVNNLRVLAMFMVVIIHTASPLIMGYGRVPAQYWLWGDFYNAISRFGVPVFVMITGALLLHREYELGDFLKRRLGRIIAPFMFWSLVYVAYSWYNEDITFTKNIWADARIVLHQLKYGAYYHLWYVYMLLGLYFFIPVLGRFVRNASEKEVIYFLLVWLAVMLLAQPCLSRFNPQIDLHYFFGYIGYLVLGHYLTFKQFPPKFGKGWCGAVFFFSLAIIVIGTYWMTINGKGLSTVFYEPLSPMIVLLSSSIFLLARFMSVKWPPFLKKTRDFIGAYTFGIYLSHALILDILGDPDDHINLNWQFCNPGLSIPLTAIVCFGLSLLLVWLISKIPFVGKWISA
jgi:surface polysaccharide O-acyltransferase-like enzyme